ncbi:MAG: ferredoxin--NADP reductase [Blastocatellia bacterium]|nr:ferredoxin--NADP reductase [Blastocatellia bacterium]
MARDPFYQAQLIERIDFTDDLALFRFRTDKPLSFSPGQYATLAVEDGDKLIQRPYSIVSSPFEAFLEFFIERVHEGELTPRLWELKPSEKVLVRNRTVGRFTLDTDSGLNRHLMLATVTGIAPYISMARTHRLNIERGETKPQHFAIIQGASHSRELGIYKDELTELARNDWLTYIPTISRPWTDPDWRGETGRVEDVIRKHADRLGFDSTRAMAYACGHPQMIENARSILARARFPKEHIKEENYFLV